MAELEYYKVLESGMFFEFYPELTGDYSKDRWEWKIIYQNLLNIRKKMDAPGHDKDYYEFVKQHRLRNKSNHKDMKQKLEYEKIETSDDSLKHLKVEPKANLQPRVSLNLGETIDRRIMSKPILVLYLDTRGVEVQEAFDFAQKQMDKYLEHGWLYLIIPIDDGRNTFIESHYFEKMKTEEFKSLQETILKEIKGK